MTGAATLTVTSNNPVQGKWTVIVFMNAANNLQPDSILNMNQMEQVAQNVRQSADVVLVRVGYEKAAHVFAALPEVGDVRNDEVDAEHLLVREHEPRIDDEDVVPDLEREHVLSDFTDATQGNDPQRGVRSSQRG